MTPLELILSRLERARKSGSEWKALCPAHEDSDPSLGIRLGDEGRVLIYCHAGCETTAVVAAIGLSMSDLYPKGLPLPTSRSALTARGTKAAASGTSGRVFPDHESATNELARQAQSWSGGPFSIVATYTYAAESGGEVGRVVRLAGSGKKTFRPIWRQQGGWALTMPRSDRPLYQLPALAGAERVVVVEGEKAADAAAAIDLCATTSLGGSAAAAKTDWSPLAGKAVLVLPDNDEPGAKYAKDVVEQLQALDPRPTIQVLLLPGLGSGEDIVDFIAAREAPGEDPSQIAAAIWELAREVPAEEPRQLLVEPKEGASTQAVPVRSAFPLRLLPGTLKRFVDSQAASLSCDPSLVAAPVLAASFAAIGNSRVIQAREDWSEPAVIWILLVARSGGVKSPALEAALKPIELAEARAIEEHRERMKEYEADCLVHEKKLAEWKKDKATTNSPPEGAEPPVCERALVNDVTVEGLAVRLQSSPRGLLLGLDEAATWFGGFNAYKKGNSDGANWLKMFGARQLTIDRKGDGGQPILIRRASVSIVGGIQPKVLQRDLSGLNIENGMAGRFLFVMPPSQQKRWSEKRVPESVSRAYANLIGSLRGMEFAVDEEGDVHPVRLVLDADAEVCFKGFYNEHAAYTYDEDGPMEAACAKLEAYALRFALVLHCVKAVERGEPDCLVVTGETMQEAINLVRWFVAEAERVYGMLSEDPAATARRRLVEYIVGKGGTMTARKLSQGPRAYRGDAERARAELDELVDLGLARREEQQTGGRPSTLYTLVVASQEVSPGDESPAESVEKDIRSRSHPPDAMCVDGVELPRGRSGSDDGHDPGTRRMEQHSAGAHPRGATATEATQDTADGGFVADQAERDETWRG